MKRLKEMNLLSVFLKVLVVSFALFLLSSCTTEKNESIKGISFADKTFDYDETAKSIYIEGELPKDIKVTYVNNNQVNAGEYIVEAHFENSEEPDTKYKVLTAKLTINPIVVELSLTDKEFVYNEEEHSLLVEGLIPNEVTIEYTNNNQTNAGEYIVEAIITNNNPNYVLPKSLKATLTILPHVLELSFDDKELVYDHYEHSLLVEGVIPNAVTIEYTNNNQVNAGEYVVKANISTDNPNYIVPETLTAILTIHKAKYNVEFDDALYIYDGKKRN